MTHAAGDDYPAADVAGTPPDPDADDVRADIAATRAELADTVDQLSAKLDVKAQAQARADEAKQRAMAKVDEARQQAAVKVDQLKQRATELLHNAPPPVQNAVQRGTDAAAPAAQQVGQKVSENRQQVAIGAGVAVLLLLLRRRRKKRKERKRRKAERAAARQATYYYEY